MPHHPCLLKFGIAAALSVLTLVPFAQLALRVFICFGWIALAAVGLLVLVSLHKRERLREKLQGRFSDQLRGPSRMGISTSRSFRRLPNNAQQASREVSPCRLCSMVYTISSREPSSPKQHVDEELGLLKAGAEEPQLGAKRAKLNQKASLSEIENLTLLPRRRKAQIWWQQEDFEKFLKVRVKLAKTYRIAAKLLNLDITEVSSIGSHADCSYQRMIELKPELAHESRRGLGLGQKKQRSLHRESFIAKVLEEQERQRKDFAATTAGGGQAYGAGKAFQLDVEALRHVASKCSQPDAKYAITRAKAYYNQFCAEQAKATDVGFARQQPESTGWPDLSPRVADGSPVGHSSQFWARSPEATPEPDDTEAQHIQVFQTHELDIQDLESKHSLFSKGYGLSRDMLQEAGLCATGHAMSMTKWQQMKRIKKLAPKCSDEELETTEGETDEEQPHDHLAQLEGKAFLEQYREWRRGASVRLYKGLTDASEVRMYGTRKEYQYWRSWAKRRPSDHTPSGRPSVARRSSLA